MGEHFLGEVKLVGFDFAPKDWSYCDGQHMPIAQNAALYAIMGNQFGGDLRTYFQLPDLRSRVPVHPSPSYGLTQGMAIGSETVTLTDDQLARHTHTFKCTTSNGESGKANPPDTMVLAAAVDYDEYPTTFYAVASNMVPLADTSSSSVGGGQPHLNSQPTLTINFIVALTGLFPTRN